MPDNHTQQLDTALVALENCKQILDKIAESCCMPQRSPNIQQAHAVLSDATTAVRLTYDNKEEAHQCITKIGELGSKVGFLYATCCTATREPMYQRIFTELVDVHGNMSGVLGHHH